MNNSTIIIHSWMISELKLKGSALLVYAIIYQYSQIDNAMFTGTTSYLSNITGESRLRIIAILEDLRTNEFIERKALPMNSGFGYRHNYMKLKNLTKIV